MQVLLYSSNSCHSNNSAVQQYVTLRHSLLSHERVLARRVRLLQARGPTVHDRELEHDVREFLDAETVRLPRNEILERAVRVLQRERAVGAQDDVELAAARGLVRAKVLTQRRDRRERGRHATREG